jgi:D-inositol-3-phosphate glycosyltransferase
MLSFHGCPFARLGEKDSGGMNVYVLQVARQLARAGNHVDIFTRCHDPDDPQVVELEDGVRLVHLRGGPLDSAKAGFYEHVPEFLANLLAFHGEMGLAYDVVHSHYWLSGPVGEVLSSRWAVPHVVTFHTLARTKKMARAGEVEPLQRALVEQRMMDKASAVVVSTEHEGDAIRSLYGRSHRNVKTIPAGVDLDLFRPMPKQAARAALGLNGDKVVLYVGRLEPLKGVDILIEALSRLDDQTGIRLMVVGGSLEGGELPRLKSWAEQLGLGASVTFTGSVDQSELPLYYNAADVFALPSYYESFGLVALEAMACGTPVVASRVGGLGAFVKDGLSGYLIPRRCPDPFAHRLDMLLATPALREKMGMAGRATALGMNWSRTADRLADLYGDLKRQAEEYVPGV